MGLLAPVPQSPLTPDQFGARHHRRRRSLRRRRRDGRRPPATSGHLISHRAIEKVFPADSHSAVGIAGAAGPAVEMVRLFQLQLEHYEKVEGRRLSIEGKANQLGAMIRANLPAAMQGLAVVPLFAATTFAATSAACSNTTSPAAVTKSVTSLRRVRAACTPGTVVKLGLPRHAQSVTKSLDLALEALFQAADDDSATGGPDLMRGIFPIVATITASGYERVDDDELRHPHHSRCSTVSRSAAGMGPHHEHALLRRTRAGHEGPSRLRAQGHRPRSQRAGHRPMTDGILLCAENPSSTLRKLSEIYDRIAFAGVGKYNEFDQLRIAGVRHADLKGYFVLPRRRRRPQPRQRLRRVPRADLHPRDEAARGRDPRRRDQASRRRRPDVPHPLRRHDRSTSGGSWWSAARARPSPSGWRGSGRTCRSSTLLARGEGASAAPTAPWSRRPRSRRAAAATAPGVPEARRRVGRRASATSDVVDAPADEVIAEVPAPDSD